jgi:hypothetical protein
MSFSELWARAGADPRALLRRLRHSAVGWSWLFNGFRLASGLLLLPLVLNLFTKPELGMYYVLLSLTALVPLVDFGFGPTLGRFITYAMGGAEKIQAQGIAAPGSSTSPNYRLLWELMVTMRTLYRYLTLALLVVLGAWGTYLVELRIQEMPSPLLVRLAWAATLLTALFDIYANWWVVYLRSMNEVLAAVRIALVGVVIRVLIASALLLAGAGLLSLPLGTLVGSFVQRHYARRRCLELLPQAAVMEKVDVRGMLATVWPNTWRLGVQFLSSYLTVNANTALCLHVLGLAANAQYGLSVQLVGFISGMAAVWTSVKWPLIGQCLARHDRLSVQQILRPRLWLQYLTFIFGCAVLLLCGPMMLSLLGGGKQILPAGWMTLMMLNTLLEMQFIIWGTLMFTENRMTYLWPTVATNVISLLLSLLLVHYSSLGLGALVLGPLLAGAIFNYWFWPLYMARSLGTPLFRYMFVGVPEQKAA